MSENTKSNLSDSYHWRKILSKKPESLTRALRLVVFQVPKAPAYIKSLIKDFLINIQKDSKLRFKSIAACIAFLIVAISILSASNPFNLLIPGSIFRFPHTEARNNVKQYGLNKKGNAIVKFQRLFHQKGTIEEQIRRVAGTIQNPVHYKDRKLGLELIEVKPLPSFANAIIQIWFQKEKKIATIDMRSETLEKELNIYFANAPVSDDEKVYYLDSWFIALTSSILEMGKEIKTIQFRLDGVKADYPKMKFKLSKKYI